ncbi:MAG: HypC/HybG/HupF family hydrogenase formation chaperone [Candidatus Omnitrophota bacterium]|jgi:hydrogenase expression/formation protein HypC
MCLAVPMKIKEIKKGFARAEAGGVSRMVNIEMLPGIKRGEYVLVHAGFAIQKVDAKRAKETLRMLDEIR